MIGKQVEQRLLISALLVTCLTLSVASTASAQVGGAIEKVWVEYGVKVDGQPGLRIHTKYSVRNAKNIACSILASAQRKDGGTLAFKTQNYTVKNGKNVIVSTYNTYATKDGTAVLISKPFTPPYDRADYSDTTLFFPYWAFNLRERSANKMKLTVTLINGGKEFARSAIDIGYEVGILPSK